MSTALLIVDLQNDFLPGGSLAVEEGNDVLPVVRRLLDVKCKWDVVIASQDFHPYGHISFASTHAGGKPFTTIQIANALIGEEKTQQTLWPDHCIQGTRGCELEHGIDRELAQWIIAGKGFVVQKGLEAHADAYSAFASSPSVFSSVFSSDALNDKNRPPLAVHLLSLGIKRLFIVGLAMDYCVRASALDAIKEGNLDTVYVIQEAVRSVGGSEATQRCQEEFKQAGVQSVSMRDEVIKEILGEY